MVQELLPKKAPTYSTFFQTLHVTVTVDLVPGLKVTFTPGNGKTASGVKEEETRDTTPIDDPGTLDPTEPVNP